MTNQTPRRLISAYELYEEKLKQVNPLAFPILFVFMLAAVTIATGLFVSPVFPVTLRWVACIILARHVTVTILNV